MASRVVSRKRQLPRYKTCPIATNRFLTAGWFGLYFSIYCLLDILPKHRLDCWRDFVLACHKITPYEISKVNLKVADLKFFSFCKRVWDIYSTEVLTPWPHALKSFVQFIHTGFSHLNVTMEFLVNNQLIIVPSSFS